MVLFSPLVDRFSDPNETKTTNFSPEKTWISTVAAKSTLKHPAASHHEQAIIQQIYSYLVH